MMKFTLYLNDSEDNTDLSTLELSLEDTDYKYIARRIVAAINKENWFTKLLISSFAYEAPFAFICGIIQTPKNKNKLIELANTPLIENNLFFRLSDYKIEHL